MLSEEEVKNLLVETEALLEGHFILSSGLRSDKYVQCAKLLMHPDKSEKICNSLSKKIKKENLDFDIVVSPAIGGIVAGYEVARSLKLPCIFTERVNGIFTLRRGFDVRKFKRALIVEDVITTGKSSIECADAIKKLGCEISGFACIIDRSSGKSLIKHKIISEISFDIPTYEPNQIPDYLKKINPIKPGSRDI